MSKVIAIGTDCEFTCFDRYAGDVIAVGMVQILDDYTIGKEAVFYSRPRSHKYFTEGAREIHKISYFKAQTFPEPKECCENINSWVNECNNGEPLAMVFHGNGGLDWKHLEAHFQKEDMLHLFYSIFPEHRIESTLSMARENLKNIQEPTIIKPDGKLVTKYSLPNISQFYDIELNHHDPLSDARTCAQIYCNIKLEKNTWTGRLF